MNKEDTVEDDGSVTLVIGFTLIDFAAMISYIAVIVAMGMLYDITAALLALGVIAIAIYSTFGIVARMMARRAMDGMAIIAREAAKALAMAGAEVAELKRQLAAKHGSQAE